MTTSTDRDDVALLTEWLAATTNGLAAFRQWLDTQQDDGATVVRIEQLRELFGWPKRETR